MAPLLSIDGLSVGFARRRGVLAAVRDVSLAVQPGECVAVVGESGSGKTQLFMAAMGLLAPDARTSGSVRFDGKEILGASARQLNQLRGSKLAMIFQDPMTSLTPHLTIGVQLAEVLVTHLHQSWRDAERAAAQMLERVRVPEPLRRLRQYPHELSGGMRQRVMIGMSLLCQPQLLIADEPTTALDVTVQAQILDLVRTLRQQLPMAIVLISHDVGVVAQLADRIVILYAGRVVESAGAEDVLRHASHPYTLELLKCVPDLKAPRLERMSTLAGNPPGPASVGSGCAFAPRCPRVAEQCRSERPPLRPCGSSAHQVACHFA